MKLLSSATGSARKQRDETFDDFSYHYEMHSSALHPPLVNLCYDSKNVYPIPTTSYGYKTLFVKLRLLWRGHLQKIPIVFFYVHSYTTSTIEAQ